MAKRQFQEMNGYPCAAETINDNLWFYVDPKGLHVITRSGGGQGHISWATVRRALEDHKKAKSRKASA